MLRFNVWQSEGERRRLMSPELIPVQRGFSSGGQTTRSKVVRNTESARRIDDDIKLLPVLLSSRIACQNQLQLFEPFLVANKFRLQEPFFSNSQNFGGFTNIPAEQVDLC